MSNSFEDYESIVNERDAEASDSDNILKTLSRVVLGGLAAAIAAELLSFGKQNKK